MHWNERTERTVLIEDNSGDLVTIAQVVPRGELQAAVSDAGAICKLTSGKGTGTFSKPSSANFKGNAIEPMGLWDILAL